MSKGYGLLVGLTSVDAGRYGGWNGTSGTWGCELDVDNIHRILKQNAYGDVRVLKTGNATAGNVLTELKALARKTDAGDIVVFYFSGHGGQRPDLNHDEIGDQQDETLVCYDRELIDDELEEAWLAFKDGVRIFMVSDSCNSGTNFRMVPGTRSGKPLTTVKARAPQMKAMMIHYGGCKDGATSAGYETGGAFTVALCNAYGAGAFNGDYRKLFELIARGVHGVQTPSYSEFGPVSDAFRGQEPFAVSSKTKRFMKLDLLVTGDTEKEVLESVRSQLAPLILGEVEKRASFRGCGITIGVGSDGHISGGIHCG